ncbi:hypothetical protein HDE_00228 [Halotydeus destructor]|nr:hypothetical protein HDE_00228 [Halotydeus destructor]
MSSATVFSTSNSTTSNGSASRPASGSTPSKNSSTSKSPSIHVNFQNEKPELSERKKKYLTAKYGQHQMSLIKKRLRVEMWMYEQLHLLYGLEDNQENNELEIDLDELMDIEDERERKVWLNVS